MKLRGILILTVYMAIVAFTAGLAGVRLGHAAEAAHLAAYVIGGAFQAQGAESGYVVEHPISPDWLILAIPEGRYTIARGEGCEWLTPPLNVWVYGVNDQAALLPRDPEWVGSGCFAYLLYVADLIPCHGGPDGLCDMATEVEY